MIWKSTEKDFCLNIIPLKGKEGGSGEGGGVKGLNHFPNKFKYVRKGYTFKNYPVREIYQTLLSIFIFLKVNKC